MGAVPSPNQPLVRHAHAGIHQHDQPGVPGSLGGFGVHDALLQPDHPGADLDGLRHDLGHELAPPEYQYEIGRVFQG